MIANRPLNTQALALEEAEAKIRIKVKDEYLKRTPKTRIDLIVRQIIIEALKRVKIKALKEAAVKSLLSFYNRQYGEMRRLFGGNVTALLAVIALADDGKTYAERKKAYDKLKEIGVKVNAPEEAKTYGVPNRKYMRDYLQKEVKPVFTALARQEPKDPDDVSGRNSLRNRAEMEVRYAAHNEQIERLKTYGNRLVIASTHADCSERCAPFQGRVYSLDGTKGTTDDGRPFVPLEVATDVYYTTKAGKRYKNGLLGFNCRHFLVPYKSGYRFPKPNEKEEKREYAITVRQRELERDVRKWRTVAITTKGVNPEAYKQAKDRAIKANNEYIRFSKDHGRAYYPSRVQLLET